MFTLIQVQEVQNVVTAGVRRTPMRKGRGWRVSLLALNLAFVLPAAFACSRGPQTPEEKRARADELLKTMSDKIAAAQTFSFASDIVRERVKADDTKVEERTTQQWIVRRPDAFAVTIKGPERDTAYWYDGKQVTFLANRQKNTRAGLPPTIDDTLDFMATHYDVSTPMADLLYSSPYEALMTPETKGGWVETETVEGQRTDHLAMQGDEVDWEIWINDQSLARQFQIKATSRIPVSRRSATRSPSSTRPRPSAMRRSRRRSRRGTSVSRWCFARVRPFQSQPRPRRRRSRSAPPK